MSEPRFLDDSANRRYRLLVADEEVGFIDYDPVGEASILIKHAEVLPHHEGKGYASRLVQSALEHVRGQHRTVIPICPFTLNWIRRHPEYHEMVQEDLRKTL